MIQKNIEILTRPDTSDSATVHYDYVDQQYLKFCLFLPNDTWLDLGGHIGSTAVQMAQTVHSVTSYEPEPSNYIMLCKNIEHNNCQNVHPVCAAVIGSGEEERWFHLKQARKGLPLHTGGHSLYGIKNKTSIKVPCRNINAVLRSTGARNIKIDVEGEEYAILMAIENWDAIDEIIFEWHPTFVKDRDFKKFYEIMALLRANFDEPQIDPTQWGAGQVVVHARKASKHV